MRFDGEFCLEQGRRLRAVALIGVLVVTLSASAAQAQENMSSEGGMGALAGLASLGYSPTKIVYATGGLIFGGMAWLFSGGDSDVMNAVLTPSVRGDYVVTPSHLRGEKQLEFLGREPEYRPQTAVVEQPY